MDKERINGNILNIDELLDVKGEAESEKLDNSETFDNGEELEDTVDLNENDDLADIEEYKTLHVGNSEDSSLQSYYRSIASFSPLTLEEELILGEKIHQGDKNALKKLLLSNLKFVVSIAMKYKHTSMPINDIINQGNIGLLEAAKRYDYTKGVKFITYAVWWIRQAIIHGLTDNVGSVRLPLKQANMLYKINSATERLSKELKRQPTVEEISTNTGISNHDIEHLVRVAKGSLSLDSAISDDGGDTFIDKLKSEDVSVEESMIHSMMKNSIDAIISELDEREAMIISLRFGLETEHPLTLEEVGERLNISRERVRQLEVRALEKLKRKAIKRKLRDYLN